MMRCDFCGNTARCAQVEIDGREFDVCEPCWAPIVEKLRGKGRPKGAGKPGAKEQAPEAFEKLPEYEEVVY